MKTIYLIHGWGGSPHSDWFPWAAEALAKLGFRVIVPEMPDTDNPKITAWVDRLKSVVSVIDESIFFIGHSIGCQAIMRFLETVDQKAGGAVFVAGWFDLPNLETEEEKIIAKPWLETPINTNRVKNNLRWSVVMLGDNDPEVPFMQTKEKFISQLGSEVIVLPGAGHVTAGDGFGPFPQLVRIFTVR